MSQKERLILTARHCIETNTGQILSEADLRFTDPESEHAAAVVFLSKATRVAYGETADWALLRADKLPPWATAELRLLDLQVAAENRWSTYGFPADCGDGQTRGQDFEGSIRMGGKTLVKLLDKTANGEVVAGLSGAPILVEEEVIGVITRADADRYGFARTGRLYVLPLSACEGLAAHVTVHEEPAFLEKTADAFSKWGTGLSAVVESLFRADHQTPVECIASPALHLALCLLLRRRLDIVPRVIAETGLREHASEILQYAACQWYPRTSAIKAARHLAPSNNAASEGTPISRAVSVGCHNNACAGRFVRRAGFDLTRSTTWHEGRIDVAWLPYVRNEPSERLTERVRESLAIELGYPQNTAPEVVKQALQEFMADEDAVRSPIFFWVPLPQETPDDDIEALRKQYPDLRLVVLGRQRPAELALPVEIDPTEARQRVAEFDAVEQKLKRTSTRSNRDSSR